MDGCMNENTAPVEWYWQGKSKYSEQNLFQRHFVNHKSHIGWTATEPGPRWEAASALARL